MMLEVLLKVNLIIAIINLFGLGIMAVMKELGKYDTSKHEKVEMSNLMTYAITTCFIFTPIINIFFLIAIINLVFFKDGIK